MTDIPLYGGPLKKSIILRAYGMCGQSVTEFELTPEEYDLGLTCLDDVCATFPPTLGYNLPPNGNGNPEDESGLDAADVLGITCLLAQEISQNVGKQFSPNKRQTQGISFVQSKYLRIPFTQMGRATVRGAGNRFRWNWMSPFFYPPISRDEPPQ